MDIQLAEQNIVLAFGGRDGIQIAHTLLTVNGVLVNGTGLEDGRDVQ